MGKNILVYIVTLLLFGWGIWVAIQSGKRLEAARRVAVPNPIQSGHPTGERLGDIGVESTYLTTNSAGVSPSPPSAGGEGRGEEGRRFREATPHPNPLPVRTSRGEGEDQELSSTSLNSTNGRLGGSLALPVAERGGAGQLISTLRENLHDPLSLLLVQLILIILLARLFGALFVRLGQPAVIGEMLAGIVLGPSLAGNLFPGAFHFIFPENSLGVLRMLSQVGVILFMFLAGMELDVKQLRDRADSAVMVSHVSIIFPYFLGVVFSLFIYPIFAPAGSTFTAFALFMGIAMSITAFPVLARILEDRGLTRTPLGAMAITCAAIDDVTAWSILAFVVAIVKAGGIASFFLTIALALAFIGVMLLIVRPSLNRLADARPALADDPTRGILVGILVLVFSSALFTEVIGIHALFGAFLAGIAMPANERFRARLSDQLEQFSSAFLLPLFFAFTGLRTQIGLLSDASSWLVCGELVLVASLGKLGGSLAAARWTGMNWRDSFALGALMNTRGLVELIVLNIGLDLGILSPVVFAMMVIMALATTCMTGPLLWAVERTRPA